MENEAFQSASDCNVKVHELEKHEIEAIQKWMLPATVDLKAETRDEKWEWETERSSVGFLGPGEDLAALCKEDDRYVTSRGLSHEKLAAALKSVVPSLHPMGDWKMPAGYSWDEEADCYSTDGCQACPFQCARGAKLDNRSCSHLFKGNDRVALKRDSDGKTLAFDSLLVHLIREHHFYEGRGTSMRLEPSSIVEFFWNGSETPRS